MDNREEIHKELGPVVEHIFLWECISCKPHSNWSTVFLAEADVMFASSIHLECLSTGPRKCLPSLLAKSMCILCHTQVSHLHGYSGALGGAFHTNWNTSLCVTISSISVFKLGHRKYLRVTAFIATIPGCSSCNSCSSRFLYGGGMITPIPNKTHP